MSRSVCGKEWDVPKDIPEKSETTTTMTDSHGNRWVPESRSDHMADSLAYSVSKANEQKSYRAGWEAGSRKADATVAELRIAIENNQVVHQRFVDGLKAQFARELRLAVDAASKGAAVYAEDLDVDLRNENADLKREIQCVKKQVENAHAYYGENPRQDNGDLAATKALLDKPYWAEGIDPDEP